jgi:thiosulfate reductase cytochrome b subunit
MRHSRLVRVTHWIHAAGFAALVVSGVAILIAHPRFYWGETGYFDTPAAFGVPLPVNLDQTGWGRSLHFLAAWITVGTGAVYAVGGFLAGHFRRRFFSPRAPAAGPASAPRYGVRQRVVYTTVVFGLLPLSILTGLTMSPAVTAAYPQLFALFGGRQSARTLHFFIATGLVLFVAAHVAMTIRSGFARNMRAMLVG